MGLSASDPLARLLAEGRPEAIAAIYDRLGPDLFRVAYSLTGSTVDAEDAVQEVFVGLVRGSSRHDQISNLQGLFVHGSETSHVSAGRTQTA